MQGLVGGSSTDSSSSSLALRVARGTSRLTDTQKRYAGAVERATGGGGGGGGEGEGEGGLAASFLMVAQAISKASRETVVVQDHEEFR